MVRSISAIILLLSAVFFTLSCKDDSNNNVNGPKTAGLYKNGVYEGATEKDWEGYTADATIEVEKGSIATVEWSIYDTNRKRTFDETYEQVYVGNPLYIQKWMDNMVGMLAYGPKLIETQDIDKVDCITEATWCWKKFQQVVKIALKDARNDTPVTN